MAKRRIPPVEKERIDSLLLKLGLVSSLKEAAAIVMTGRVEVSGKKCLYPSQKYESLLADKEGVIKILPPRKQQKYVSRGGLKLEGALEDFSVDVRGKICIDVGASTGGFTDVLLRNGAAKVYAFDVGKNLLHEKISSNERVVRVEDFNFKNFPAAVKDKTIDGGCSFKAALTAEIAVCDVSFISVIKIIRALSDGLTLARSITERNNIEIFDTFYPLPHQKCEILALVKPQFELPPEYLRKGVVKDPLMSQRAVLEAADEVGKIDNLEVKGFVPSRIKGAQGNEEFFLHIIKHFDV